MTKYNNTKFSIILPIVIALSILIGVMLSEILNNGSLKETSLFQQQDNKLNLIIDYVSNEYVDEVDIKSLSEKAIPILLKGLDPHSVYFSAEDAKTVEEELNGQFDGIGIKFHVYKDTILVVNVIKGGPSEKYGLKDGDRIVKVNDSVVAGIDINNKQVVSMLKGPKGTKVDISVFRRGEKDLLKFSIVRGSIPLRSIDGFYMIDNEIAYIKIGSFSINTYEQFVDAVSKLKEKGMKSIIVDLRNNSGGYLRAATHIIDEFFGSNYTIVYTEGRARPKNIIKSTKNRNSCLNLDVVVLIDEYSASASEIFAGTIQDNDRGFVVGRRSYGKGLVQEETSFDDGSILRITTARYYTPSGRCIQKSYDKGIDEYYSDIYNRYAHGEFLQKDSVKQIDSLIYFTTKGRPVYGGGGITPDVFVPIDTSVYSKLSSDVFDKNLEYYFAIEYIDKYRNELCKLETLKELKEQMQKNNAINSFWEYVKNNDINISEADLEISGADIEIRMTAYISQLVLGENEFYEVINHKDRTVDSALNILKSKRKL